VVIGDGVIIEVHAGACLDIGPETFINPNARVIALESIRIGADCAVAWDVQIMDGDRHFFLNAEGQQEKNTAPIQIGDHVWIGARSLILKGAHIDNGAVIGAGSVVSGRVGAGVVVAGNPAKVIREGVQWAK
jgi:acetyltransferase-like isoleucine patch superfamily enzyme